MFTGWVYDFLRPHALKLKVAHPEMLKAITAAKRNACRSLAGKPSSRVLYAPSELKGITQDTSVSQPDNAHSSKDEE